MKRKPDALLGKVVGRFPFRKCGLPILLMGVPLLFTGINRYISETGYTLGFGDYVEMLIESVVLGSIGVYIYHMFSQRTRIIQRLRESEKRYRAIFENAAVGINLSDRQGRFLQVNSASRSMLGYSREELNGLTVFDVTHPEDLEVSKVNFADLIEGKVDSYRLQKRFVRKDADVVWADLVASAIRDHSGDHAAILGVIVDITDRKRTEEEKEILRAQLLQSQKMEAIGTLAGGIAHEFNNLLAIISGYTELLMQEKDENHPDLEDLKKIHLSSRRGAELVNALLTYSGKSVIRKAPVNLNQEIEKVKDLLVGTIPRMIEIKLTLSNELERVYGDPGQMRQLIMNLALNARDAMPEGGTLTLETKNVAFPERDSVTGLEGEYVQLSVSDNGTGMDEMTISRIFEPFYSTHGLAYKKGLGLAVSHGIVKCHGGHMDCESRFGKGTIFRVYLPAMSDAAVERQAFSLDAFR